ncbi:ABC transporter permease [Vagococcus carniphilus]|uniref:ABC transporter permease n=1 Tax=Vagococcus carniphilus TaxID=218144 RepID=UPI00288F38D1|nr:ABC transporter permease [Vagococcus carniphilus]MDT2849938.1 ABC transporter permease [Vagococcus carniphilus]MDT2866287.1 ABC transporter permease [Vagococcus carniphilus]
MRLSKLANFLLGMISFILFWYFLFLVTNNPSIPHPFASLKKAWDIKNSLFLHTGASFLRIFISLILASLVSVPLGILLARFKKVNRLFSPLIYFLYPLPKVAFLPIFMIFFGLGNTSKILLIFSIISLQLLLSIRDGVNQIPKTYYQVMKDYHSSHLQELRYVTFPALIPTLFSSLRVSVAISLASLFFAENYATTYGLGYLIMGAWTKMDYEELFVGILAIAVLGFFIFTLLDELEKRLMPYHSF